MEALFPKPAPVTEASLESILPPGSHLGNQMKDAIRQNTLPYQEGSGTLTDAARQIDFALLQTVLRLKLDKGRILLLTSDYRTQGKDIYHLQRMRIYLPPVVQDPAQQAPRNENGNAPSAETGDVKGPPNRYSASSTRWPKASTHGPTAPCSPNRRASSRWRPRAY